MVPDPASPIKRAAPRSVASADAPASRFDGRLISGVGVFATAVETGSFVRTSQLAGLTTSGVSRAIARLEDRLGVRLFHRTPRGIQVTEEGRRFYEQTSSLIDQLAASANQIRSCHGEVQPQPDTPERPPDRRTDPYDLGLGLEPPLILSN